MSHILTPEQLATEDIVFRGIEAVAQRWTPPNMSFSYLQRPRPNTGLFFLCADLTMSFCVPHSEPVTIRQGSVALLPKGLFYKAVMQGDATGDPRTHSYVVNFDPVTPEGLPLSLGTAPTVLCTSTSFEALPLATLVGACHDIPRKPLKVQALFFEILADLFREIHHTSNGYYPIRRGVALLRQEWRENHRIARYAAACGISESHFHTLFKEWAGVTPVEYRNNLRLSYACSQLQNSAGSIEEIARQVGFDDPFYFSRLFKKQMGVTPREYRQG